jgi:hypothetical protein
MHLPARSLAVLALVAAVVPAQAQDTSRLAQHASVSGFAVDSLSRRPLRGAIIQLVDADSVHRFSRTAKADSLGHFKILDVPSGRYALGFFHPLLDSLGIEPPLHEVRIIGTLSVETDVAIPSAGRLRIAMCGGHGMDETAAVVVGAVRDARTGQPVPGAIVVGRWMEAALKRTGLATRIVTRTATSASNGWFMLCNVPSPGLIQMFALSTVDSTDRIEVQVPSDGFLRRELLIGKVDTVTRRDSAIVSRDSATVAPAGAVISASDGRVSGSVFTLVENRPLVGARVSTVSGQSTRVNERGEFTLTDVPMGTRMVEINAIGYYPERVAVDVTGATPALKISMSTLRAVLDTIHVTAPRLRANEIAGFNARKGRGAGRFLGAEDVMRHNPQRISDIFRNLPGIKVVYDRGAFDGRIMMRGNMYESCTPALFIDGLRISGSDGFATPGITTEDLDGWVRPADVVGIEVYDGPSTPLEFQQGMRTEARAQTTAEISSGQTINSHDSSCGAIVIWRK